MVKRKSLIIYFRNPKVLRNIEKIADITYFTKKKKYAVIYVDESEKDSVMAKIKEMKLVRRVEESLFETDDYNIDFNVQ